MDGLLTQRAKVILFTILRAGRLQTSLEPHEFTCGSMSERG